MEKTKNDLKIFFSKFADGKMGRRREGQQKFLLPSLFLSLLFSTVAVSQLFFFLLLCVYIYIFYSFMLPNRSFILLNISICLIQVFFFFFFFLNFRERKKINLVRRFFISCFGGKKHGNRKVKRRKHT